MIMALALLLISSPGHTMENDDPLLTALFVEELEWREDDELVWDAEAWIGKDRDKLWFKTEGESSSDATEEFETQALYSRAVSPYWNLQTGWRGDWQPESRRSWFAIGAQGLAPGFIESTFAAFVGDGRSSLRARGEYEMRFTQRISLMPRAEVNWYSDEDEVNGIGDGISNFELVLRLHYRIRPDLSPYIGVAYNALYGDTADFAEEEGERDRTLQVLAGLSFWF
jgi:copper resistance protein B